MHDRHPVFSVFALLFPLAALAAALCIWLGGAVEDAILAVMKLVVIR